MRKTWKTALLATALLAATGHATDSRQVVKTLQGPITAVGTVRGLSDSGRWVGGAVAIAQNHCYIAATTAGHNIKDGNGLPTSPLASMSIRIGQHRLAVVEALMDPQHTSTTPPEHDWAVVIAQKPACGIEFATLAPRSMPQQTIPSNGMPVALACYHHDHAALLNKLSTQQCRMYKPGEKFDGLYSNKAGSPVALHSCTAKLGTSGCPIIVQHNGQPQFVGTQIEAHYTSGASVARLFDGNYQKAYQNALTRMRQLSRAQIRLSAN